MFVCNRKFGEKKQNFFVENFYSMRSLPPSSWFIFSKVAGTGSYGDKKTVTERYSFSVIVIILFILGNNYTIKIAA